MGKLFILAILFFQCSFSNKEHPPVPAKSYDMVKTDIALKKQKFKEQYEAALSQKEKKKILSEAGIYLYKNLVDTIFPYWYGTTWDFNGYTDKPGEGLVACGYFVSTPLKHCGFNLNRFKLAQQYSLEIVNRISCGDSVWSYSGINSWQFLQKTKGKLKEGLYVVGLDNHVGYLLYEKGEVYFIHSSYLDPGSVVREKASESLALATSQVFVMSNISSNAKLIKKWIMGEEIKHMMVNKGK
jgi:hypothetical protein